MKFTPEIESVLAANFAGEELVKVKELWSKKKGKQSYIADGKLTCSKEELVAKLSNKAAKSEKASAKVDLSKMTIPQLKELIEEAQKLIKERKDAEIAELEARLKELKAL